MQILKRGWIFLTIFLVLYGKVDASFADDVTTASTMLIAHSDAGKKVVYPIPFDPRQLLYEPPRHPPKPALPDVDGPRFLDDFPSKEGRTGCLVGLGIGFTSGGLYGYHKARNTPPSSDFGVGTPLTIFMFATTGMIVGAVSGLIIGEVIHARKD